MSGEQELLQMVSESDTESVETSPYFKTVELTTICNRSKQIISVSSELELLQGISPIG